MTNSSLRYALDGLCAAALCLAAGCGGTDPAKEFAAGESAFALKDYKTAAGHYAKGLELSPENVDALVMYTRVLLATGELDKAAETLAKAAATNGDDSDVVELSAQLAFYRKDYPAAYKAFSRLANDDKLTPETRSVGWAGMGVVDYFLVGSASDSQPYLRDRARTELLRATQLDRRNASARYHLGRLYRDSFGFVEAAKEQFDFFVHLELEADARVQKAQREVIPALKDEIARKAASRPGVAKRDAVACTAALTKADALFRKGDFRGARAGYSDAYAKDPLSYPAAIGLAKSLEKSAKTDAERKDAFKAYCQACDLSPSAVQTFITAGDLAMKLGSFASAAKLYSRAMAASPTNTTVVDGLIRALTKSGDGKTAAVYQRYRDTIPKRK